MTAHITLKQLEVFATTARKLSFTHAAKLLNMTQPAVSTQIKNLEEQLDIKLFDYVSKKLTLTDAGRDIYRKIQEVQEKVEELKQFVSNLKGAVTGNLNIAIPQGSQKKVFQIISAFYENHPQINLDIKVVDRHSQLYFLKNGQIDFSLIEKPPKEPSLYSDPLFSCKFHLIAPANHPLASKQKISFADIANETFVVGEHDSQAKKILEEKIIKKSSKRIYVDNLDSMRCAVEAGLGLAIMPENTLAPERNKKDYAILDLEEFPIQSQIHLVHRHKKLMSPLALAFKKFAQEYCMQASYS